MRESLKNKAVKGVSWSFVDNIANSGITFLVGLILARILTPKEYGIMAMITIFIAVSNSIIDSGFSNALIRKSHIKRVDYNTVFYFNLIVGFFLCAILFGIAPFISSFFHEPILIPVTRVISLVLIINSLSIIQRTILVREVNFKTQTKASLISSLSSGIVGISMAFYGYGIWSLVGQQLSRQFLNTLLLWVYSHWRPNWEFSKESFNELFGFGSKLLLSGLIDTIYKNIYYFIIGHFYTASQLGQYTRAEQFSNIFSVNLVAMVQRVSYPVLSNINNNDSERLLVVYRKILKVVMCITFFSMLSLSALSKPIVLVLIGNSWNECVKYLQIICFAAILYPAHMINQNILQVKGRMDIFLHLEIIKKIISILPIIMGIINGIYWLLLGSVFVSIISFFLNSFYSGRLICYSTLVQLKDISSSFCISFTIAFVLYITTFIFPINVYTLCFQILIGIFLFIMINERMKLDEYIEIKKNVLFLLRKNG